jgi:hypothetical protein
MTDEERKVWENSLEDALWWKNSDEHMAQTVDRLRSKVVVKNIVFSFDQDAVSQVQNAMYQKAMDKLEGTKVDESDLLARFQNVEPILKEASQASTDILSDLLVNKTLSLAKDSILKFGIDFDKGNKDNKVKVVEEVSKGLSECYQELSEAACAAGQEILTQRIDMEADNVTKDLQ